MHEHRERKWTTLALWICAGLAGSAPTALAQATNAAAPKSHPDAALEGRWAGELHHGAQTSPFGLEFTRAKDGALEVLFWMPALQSYGGRAGRVVAREGGFEAPDSKMRFELATDTLTGTFAEPTLTFSLTRRNDLPATPVRAAIPTGPEPLWKYQADGALWTSPVVSKDVAFVADAGGTVHAVRLDDGRSVWKRDLLTGLFGNVLAAGDALFVLGDDGWLYKLDAASGDEIWHAELGGGDVARRLPGAPESDFDYRAPTPVLDAGVLYFGRADGVFTAVRAEDGEPLWSFESGAKIRGDACVAGDRVVFGSFDHKVYALDKKTGRKLWSFDTGEVVNSTPTLAGNNVVIGSRSAKLFALSLDAGKPLWESYMWLSWVESSAVLAERTLYIGSSDYNRVVALDPAKGTTTWETEVFGWAWAPPLVAANTLYIGTAGTAEYFAPREAALCALDRRSGKFLWRRPLTAHAGAAPSGIASACALAKDKLLVSDLDGTLWAFPATIP